MPPRRSGGISANVFVGNGSQAVCARRMWSEHTLARTHRMPQVFDIHRPLPARQPVAPPTATVRRRSVSRQPRRRWRSMKVGPRRRHAPACSATGQPARRASPPHSAAAPMAARSGHREPSVRSVSEKKEKQKGGRHGRIARDPRQKELEGAAGNAGAANHGGGWSQAEPSPPLAKGRRRSGTPSADGLVGLRGHARSRVVTRRHACRVTGAKAEAGACRPRRARRHVGRRWVPRHGERLGGPRRRVHGPRPVDGRVMANGPPERRVPERPPLCPPGPSGKRTCYSTSLPLDAPVNAAGSVNGLV